VTRLISGYSRCSHQPLGVCSTLPISPLLSLPPTVSLGPRRLQLYRRHSVSVLALMEPHYVAASMLRNANNLGRAHGELPILPECEDF
jgi:hypothetical protein